MPLARFIAPVVGREVGDVERLGQHEYDIWLSDGFIEPVRAPAPTAPPVKRAAVKRTPPPAKK